MLFLALPLSLYHSLLPPAGCGGTLTGTGQIRSPFHPNAYPHNKECEWVINQEEGYVVTLNFLSFDVEENSCLFDFVEVNLSHSPLFSYTFIFMQQPADVVRLDDAKINTLRCDYACVALYALSSLTQCLFPHPGEGWLHVQLSSPREILRYCNSSYAPVNSVLHVHPIQD